MIKAHRRPDHLWLPALLTTVLALSYLTGCGDDEGITTQPLGPGTSPCGRLLVITTDYTTGSVAVVDADSSYQAHVDLASVNSDAVARVHGGLVYVVNRLGGDNIQVLDPADGLRTIRQFSVGPGTNPHDIAFVSGARAYVSRNGSASLLEVDPRSGEVRDEVSLLGFADADGIPDMDRMIYSEPYLFVAVQRIDFGGGTYEPVPPSYLVVIDTRDNSVVDVDPGTEGVQGIVLRGLNPITPIVWDQTGTVLLVACAGEYGVLDGGIERIDPLGMRSLGWLVTEEELGGDLIDFTIGEGTRGYATISDPSFVTSLVAFDSEKGSPLETILVSDGYELADLIMTRCGDLVVCDRDYQEPGLRIFNAETGQAVASVSQPISTGLPPFELLELGE